MQNRVRATAAGAVALMGAALIAPVALATPTDPVPPDEAAVEEGLETPSQADESSAAGDAAATDSTAGDEATEATDQSSGTEEDADATDTESTDTEATAATQEADQGAPQGAPAAADAATVDLTMLGFSDFHGRIDDNTVNFAGTIEEQREIAVNAGSTPFTAFAGDTIGASLFASAVAEDQPTIDVLNAIGIDGAAVGNHEFDRGYDDLVNRVIDGGNNAEWPYLGANVYDAGTTNPALQPYALTVVDGVSVALIGVVTEETPTLVSPDGVSMLDFGDPVEAVNRYADLLTDGTGDEADIILVAMHEGPATDDSYEAALSSAVFSSIVNDSSAKIDAILLGHTNQVLAWDGPIPGVDGQTRPIVQAGAYGENLAVVNLSYDPATDTVVSYDASIVERTATPAEDLIASYPAASQVNDIVTAALADAGAVGEQVVGYVGADITTANTEGYWEDGEYKWNLVADDEGNQVLPSKGDDRSSESTLGDFVANALVASLGDADRGGAQIGVVNPGGLRAELYYGEDGAITYSEANAVLPFLNNLWTTTLTGSQVIEMLEQQWQVNEDGEVPSRPYLQLGLSENVTYTYDPDPDGDGVLVGDLDDQGQHITSVMIDGSPIDEGASYVIGSFSFLLQGGDNFSVFTEGSNTADSGLVDREAWIAYLETFTADAPAQPDFARQGVSVPYLEVPCQAMVGGSCSVDVEVANLNLTSLGSPENTSVTVWLAGVELGTFDVVDGMAAISAVIPNSVEAGWANLQVVATESGTTVLIPVEVPERELPTETPTVEPTDDATPTATAPGGQLSDTGADVTTFVIVALALLAAGVAVVLLRRRQSSNSEDTNQ